MQHSALTQIDISAEPETNPEHQDNAHELHVSVSHPQKNERGVQTYFTYRVNTKTSLQNYKQNNFSAIRRFSDFAFLHTCLADAYPGAIVPPLPKKHSAQVSTMRMSGVGCSPEWVEERRAHLQIFIQRVCAHPLLYTLPDVKLFLEASEEEFEARKQADKERKSGAHTSMLDEVKGGLFSIGKSSMSLFGQETPASFEPQGDIPCQQMYNYVAALEQHIASVHRHSSRFIERHRSLANSTGSLGHSLSLLSDCERKISPNLAEAFSAMGLAMDGIATQLEEHANGEGVAFDGPLCDYIRQLAQCRQAIDARHTALAVLNAAGKTLALRREKLAKLRSSTSANEVTSERLSVASREVTEAESLQTVARQEYEQVASRLDGEMARFQREKVSDFKRMVVDFLELQLAFSGHMEAAWRNLLPSVKLVSE